MQPNRSTCLPLCQDIIIKRFFHYKKNSHDNNQQGAQFADPDIARKQHKKRNGRQAKQLISCSSSICCDASWTPTTNRKIYMFRGNAGGPWASHCSKEPNRREAKPRDNKMQLSRKARKFRNSYTLTEHSGWVSQGWAFGCDFADQLIYVLEYMEEVGIL